MGRARFRNDCIALKKIERQRLGMAQDRRWMVRVLRDER